MKQESLELNDTVEVIKEIKESKGWKKYKVLTYAFTSQVSNFVKIHSIIKAIKLINFRRYICQRKILDVREKYGNLFQKN